MATQLHRDLQRFLHHRLTNEDAKAAIRRRLRQRERSFLRLMKHAVYANPRSPYRMLLRHIGITFQDLTRSVVSEGVEATLARRLRRGHSCERRGVQGPTAHPSIRLGGLHQAARFRQSTDHRPS